MVEAFLQRPGLPFPWHELRELRLAQEKRPHPAPLALPGVPLVPKPTYMRRPQTGQLNRGDGAASPCAALGKAALLLFLLTA